MKYLLTLFIVVLTGISTFGNGIIKSKEQKDLTSVNCPSIRGTSSEGTDEVIGACFRFYTSIPGADEVMREVRFPRLLSENKYPWKVPDKKKKFKL